MALGSAALALNLPLSTDEALGGLVMPAAAYVLIGKSGTEADRCLLCGKLQPPGLIGYLLSVPALLLLYGKVPMPRSLGDLQMLPARTHTDSKTPKA